MKIRLQKVQCLLAVGVLFALVPSPTFSDDFNWSWQQTRSAAAPAVTQPAPAVTVHTATGAADRAADGFHWGWQGAGQGARAEEVGRKTEDRGASTAGARERGTTVAPEVSSTAQPIRPAQGGPAVATKGSEVAVGPAVGAAGAEGPKEAGGGAKALDVGGYSQLLKENLDLRKKLETASKEEEKVAGENARLQSEIKELELKITEFAGMVQTLKKKEITVEGRAHVQEMESKLQKTEEEKRRLLEELAVLKEAGDERQKSVERPSTAGSPPMEKTAAVQPGSDLYRRLEQENLDLREKLTRLDAERQQTVQAHAKIAADESKARTAVQQMTETEKQLREALEAARAQASEHKAKNEDLLKQIPSLEKDLAVVSKDAEQKGQALTAREQQLEVLQDELRRREQRLIKAEKMAAILEQAREQVREMSEKEKRDLHYNMGSIYAKEGRFKEAEAEYIKALKLDPSDADVHYNLGILYDEELKDKRRAAMHYRRYLQLNPHSPDADAVRGWLMAIDAR